MKSLREFRTPLHLDEQKMIENIVAQIDDFSMDDLPDFIDRKEIEQFINEGIGAELLKNLLPRKVLHSLKRSSHKEQYKVAIKLYHQIRKDKTRNLSDDMAMNIAAQVVGVGVREFRKVMDKQTRYEENQNGQKYIEPSVKETGKVLEDGLPETTKAYAAMVPGQSYEQIMNIISEKAPPDKDIETWIKKNKKRFIDQYGEDDFGSYLYGRAWNMYNKKHGINESALTINMPPVLKKFHDVKTKNTKRNYADIINAHGKNIHSLMKDLEKERNQVMKDKKTVKAGMMHDMAIKAYRSMQKQGMFKESLKNFKEFRTEK